MRMNGVHQRFNGRFGFHRQHAFADEFEGLRTDDVDAQNLAISLLCHHLDEPIVLAQDRRFAIRGEREFADLDFEPLGPRLRFGHSDAADAGFGVGRARNVILVDRRGRLAGHMRDGDHSFGRCDVRQLWRARDNVADGINAGFAGALELIHLNEAAVQFDACAFEADIFRIRLASDGYQETFRFHRLGFSVGESHVEAHALIGLHYAGRIQARACFHANAAFLKHTRQFLGNLFVLDRDNTRQHFKNRYLTAEALEAGGELDTHRAGPENRHRSGHMPQIQDLDVSQDAGGVRLQTRQHARFRSRGEQNEPRFQDLPGALGCRQFDLPRPRQLSVALDPFDLVLLHQVLDAFGVLGNDSVSTVADERKIQARILAMNAFLVGMDETIPNIRRVQEGFGRNAADMQTASAKLGVFLNNGGFQAVLTRANGRRIPTGTAPDDDYVVCHVLIFFQCSRACGTDDRFLSSVSGRHGRSMFPELTFDIRPELVVRVRPKPAQETQPDANGGVAGRRVTVGAPGIRQKITPANRRVTGIGRHDMAVAIFRVERHLGYMSHAMTEGLSRRAWIAWILAPYRAQARLHRIAYRDAGEPQREAFSKALRPVSIFGGVIPIGPPSGTNQAGSKALQVEGAHDRPLKPAAGGDGLIRG